MSRLVKLINGVVHVAQERVATPMGTVYVSEGRSAFGWSYYTDDVEPDSFVLPWAQPSSAEDAYAQGAIVEHNGSQWQSLMDGNVWEPGVAGWGSLDNSIPDWVQPTGAHDAYAPGALVRHNGAVWLNTLADEGSANTWEPGVSGWRQALLSTADLTAPPPDWVQPTGAHDAYQSGDRVTHAGQQWTSTVDSNTWEPGVYGWTAD